MTVAQTRAARRKFKQYYRNDNPIGTPHYERKSVSAMERREKQLREKMKLMAARKGVKKK